MSEEEREVRDPETAYLAFLLRLWRERGSFAWRASLENPHTGARASFAELPSLVGYLQDLTSDSGDPAAPTRPKIDPGKLSAASGATERSGGPGDKREHVA